MKVNSDGTVNALEAACRNDIERFVMISSSEVYGDSDTFPLKEDHTPAPVSIYGVSKLAAEAYCLAFHAQRKLKTTCLRMFNVYGPGQRESFVIPIFISGIVSGKPPIIYGHGNQSRCYTYITDAVKGIMLAMTAKEAVGEVFNIGNTEEVTVLQLADYLIGLLDGDMKPVYQPFGDGIRVEGREIFRRQPDILKAMTRLGFDIEVSWKEGVKRFCDWFLENNKR
jgi:UDP-glucose 4-epimerase